MNIINDFREVLTVSSDSLPSALVLQYLRLLSAAINDMEGGDVTDAHITADEMDEKRKSNMAYEYLCHLEEAKK